MPPPEEINSLLFHELVHVCQYGVLGLDRFVTLYLSDWRQQFDYDAIRLERQAFALEARFRRQQSRPIDVLREVERFASRLGL